MLGKTHPSIWSQPSLEAHLLGTVDFDTCLTLQGHVVRQIGDRDDGQVCLLLCEHPPVVTIGRAGSLDNVHTDYGLLRSGRVALRWVKRGGGCLVHAPGQLAIYPIVPLRWHNFTVGDFLDRLQLAILRALEELGIQGHPLPGTHGVGGRTGQLAACGVAVRNWVTWHGTFLNVSPPMGLFRLIDTDRPLCPRMSCLVAERGHPVRMTRVRAEVVRHLAAVLGCDRYHLYTGHPLLRPGAAAQTRPTQAV